MSRFRVSILVVAVLLSGSLLFAGPTGETYGTGVDGTETITPLELLDAPDKYLGKNIRVEGQIKDVCPKRGCWIDIVGKDGEQEVRFKVEDDVIVFPVELKGKHVVAQGVLSKHELTEDAAIRWLGHLADEKGEEFDPSTVDGPMTLYQIDGTGAVVYD